MSAWLVPLPFAASVFLATPLRDAARSAPIPSTSPHQTLPRSGGQAHGAASLAAATLAEAQRWLLGPLALCEAAVPGTQSWLCPRPDILRASCREAQEVKADMRLLGSSSSAPPVQPSKRPINKPAAIVRPSVAVPAQLPSCTACLAE